MHLLSNIPKNTLALEPIMGLSASIYGEHALEIAQALIGKGADVNLKGCHGMTALMIAAHHSYKKMVTFLIAHGADVHAMDDNGDTALLRIRGGSVPIAQALIEAGSDVNAKGHLGFTPLMSASISSYHDLVALYLAHGARVDETDDEGSTAMHKAAQGGCEICCQLLLDAGADINKLDNLGYAPIKYAVDEFKRFLIDKGATTTS